MKTKLALALLFLGCLSAASAQTTFPNATTYPPLIVPMRSLGTTSPFGLILQNPTLAAAGAQQYSPGLLWEGQGWKTTSTAASQQVDFLAQVVPVQGTTAPTANWVLSAAIAGGSYTPVWTVSSAGIITPAGSYTSLTSSGAILSTGTPGIGYSTGAGGAVTQLTNRTTPVTLNTPTGAITLVAASGSATAATFTVTDSIVAATDTIIVNEKSGTDLYEIFVTNVAAGSFKITSFTTGGTTSESPVFNFTVIKGSLN